MKSLFTFLRAVVWLKRIALALETANEMKNREMTIQHGPEWNRPKRAPALVKISRPTVAEWNKAYRQSHPSEAEETE